MVFAVSGTVGDHRPHPLALPLHFHEQLVIGAVEPSLVLFGQNGLDVLFHLSCSLLLFDRRLFLQALDGSHIHALLTLEIICIIT